MLPLKEMLPDPDFAKEVEISDPVTVVRSLRGTGVFALAVRGAVGGVKFAVAIATPLWNLRSEIYPLK